MVQASVSAAGMRVVKLLVGNQPLTVAELIKATGVTRTAVTEQLNELLAARLVERTVEHLAGRGRPRHLYAATPLALAVLFASNQHLVVPAIWQALRDIGGEKLTREVARRVSQQMADHYSRRIRATEPKQRLKELVKLLNEEGALVETQEKDGRFMMYKRTCPFISMLDENRSVCTIDQDMIARVVGRPVHRTCSRHNGDTCCAFELNGEG